MKIQYLENIFLKNRLLNSQRLQYSIMKISEIFSDLLLKQTTARGVPSHKTGVRVCGMENIVDQPLSWQALNAEAQRALRYAEIKKICPHFFAKLRAFASLRLKLVDDISHGMFNVQER